MHNETCPCCDCTGRRPSVSLHEWFDLMAVNPYYGFQLAQRPVGSELLIVPLSSTPCAELVYENPTQGGQIAGRSTIWSALLAADEKFRNFTGYWPSPSQECDEIHFHRPYSGGTIRLTTSKLKALGEITHAFIETIFLTEPMFLDLNGDTVLDTVRFTIDRPLDIDHESEVVVFLSEGDREFVDSFYRSQVRPIKIKVTGETTLQIDIPVWNLVLPVLYRGYAVDAIDPNDFASYVATVDIYREWVDDSRAITIMRRTDAQCACTSTATECYDCENVSACVVNAGTGLIRLDMRESAGSCYCAKCAHRICIRYVAGGCDYGDVLARLAAAELRGDICCGTSPEVRYWQGDYVGLDSRGRATTSLLISEQGNPFGTKRGQVEAYRFLKERRAFKIVRI